MKKQYKVRSYFLMEKIFDTLEEAEKEVKWIEGPNRKDIEIFELSTEEKVIKKK